MKKKNTDRYQSPVADHFRVLPDSVYAASEEVETVAPEDWEEGNTDWWNS